jgi:hypothetical protein
MLVEFGGKGNRKRATANSLWLIADCGLLDLKC